MLNLKTLNSKNHTVANFLLSLFGKRQFKFCAFQIHTRNSNIFMLIVMSTQIICFDWLVHELCRRNASKDELEIRKRKLKSANVLKFHSFLIGLKIFILF